MRSRASLLGAAAVVLFAKTSSAADPVPSLDLRGFHPPTDPASSLYLEPVTTPGPGNWNIGAWASYALSPVVLEDPRTHDVLARVVHHQASMDYLASIGIGNRWAIGLSVPTLVYQTGDDVSALLPGSTKLPSTTIGSPAASVKANIIAPSDLGGFGLSLLGRVFVPGDARSYASDGSVRGEARVLGEVNLLAVSVRATAGFRARAREETLIDDGTDRYRFGHDIPWGLGVTLRPQVLGIDREGRFRVTAEGRGAIAATPKFAAGPSSPALLGLSTRYTVKELSVIAGLEVPLNDAVGNPVIRPVLGIGWAPRFLDADHDGIEDEADECPELAEDKDGFEDNDGCPDSDNDNDGVDDDKDRCPRELEDADEFQDDDGCPDPDNDGDGVRDAEDACPNEPGVPQGPKRGCPDPDPDHDGILGDKDRCPNAPEDKDEFQDQDGCPDPDNDGDGVLDPVDACPLEKGEPNAATELNGCPNPDHDGDTFDDTADKCPRDPEDFDGIEDDDGCPDEKPGKPLVVLSDVPDGKAVQWQAPRFVKDDIDPKSMPVLRALAAELNRHADWIAVVGVRPAAHTPAGEQLALNRAFAIATTLRWLTHRDAAAEAVGFRAVHDLPGAEATGVGVLVLAPKHPQGGATEPSK